MPLGGLLYLSIPEPLSEVALAALRGGFVAGVGLDPLADLHYPGIPLQYEEMPDFLPDPSAYWYEANLCQPYYGPGYERGDLPLFVRCAEWLESAVPGAKVWYGNDCTDESIRPFGPVERAQLLEYYNRVGHEPYDRRRSARREKSGTEID